MYTPVFKVVVVLRLSVLNVLVICPVTATFLVGLFNSVAANTTCYYNTAVI
jgi:hypothetical protein